MVTKEVQMCSYCNWEQELPAPVSALQEHVEKECPLHPLRKAVAERDQLRAENEQLRAEVELVRKLVRLWKSNWDQFLESHPEEFAADREQAREALKRLSRHKAS